MPLHCRRSTGTCRRRCRMPVGRCGRRRSPPRPGSARARRTNAKGIVMRPGALRPATARTPPVRQDAHPAGGRGEAQPQADGHPGVRLRRRPGSASRLCRVPVGTPADFHRAAALGMPAPADSGYRGAGVGALVPRENPAGNQEADKRITGIPSRITEVTPRRPRRHSIRAQIHQGKLSEIPSVVHRILGLLTVLARFWADAARTEGFIFRAGVGFAVDVMPASR
jgi:hypothetical protein